MQAYESVTLRSEQFDLLNLADQLAYMADAIRDCENAAYQPSKISFEEKEGKHSIAVLMRRKTASYDEFLRGIIARDLEPKLAPKGKTDTPDTDNSFGAEDILPRPEPPRQRNPRPARPKPSKEVDLEISF